MPDIMAMDGPMREALAERLGGVVVSRGRLHMLQELPGLAAVGGTGEIAGCLFYAVSEEACEIVSLESFRENEGVGSGLIGQVRRIAEEAGCSRLWLITTNENIRAIRFYQRRGFDMKALHVDAVAEARKLKPSIPLQSGEGIPIRHEIEFEMRLNIEQAV
ncbi:acetyltransferase [Paenibacillus mucilaginosus 3016]|uniref:Acetyltransferase n=1 Tax=Paenibacillus mucilaginosus 3016 TaxID=1116391 RepID=H6NMT5_9BACL|nr:GNAT family N-acetyltransferase [Paenibacillus mucilaginosus]AFC30422.1 acetyltransferase [Paenibacillus mucilaginosus 3016]WFA19060.1 GNAT family N-acetyltransferase [Paenibacillus mucilaginosus]